MLIDKYFARRKAKFYLFGAMHPLLISLDTYKKTSGIGYNLLYKMLEMRYIAIFSEPQRIFVNARQFYYPDFEQLLKKHELNYII